MPMRLAAAVIAFALCGWSSARACSCITFDDKDAVTDFSRTDVVFVGRVIRDTGPELGARPARMVVEEVLRGLPKNIHEIDVDSYTRSDCSRRLAKDDHMVIYAVRNSKRRDTVNDSKCSYTFRVEGNEKLLGRVREAARSEK
jgi:hypothetical protein